MHFRNTSRLICSASASIAHESLTFSQTYSPFFCRLSRPALGAAAAGETGNGRTNPRMQDETNDLARASVAGSPVDGADDSLPEHDLLSEIPSPTRRLWLGLCVTLAIFAIFASYTIREIRGLQDFQVNVVQK